MDSTIPARKNDDTKAHGSLHAVLVTPAQHSIVQPSHGIRCTGGRPLTSIHLCFRVISRLKSRVECHITSGMLKTLRRSWGIEIVQMGINLSEKLTSAVENV